MGHRHWRTGDVYEIAGGGLVRVQRPDGTSGLFHPDGRWHSGELTGADPHMIEFVVGVAGGASAPAVMGEAPA